MGCSGPFKYGVAGDLVCGCLCPESKCCPPACCSSVTLTYEIGTSYDIVPSGCHCDTPSPSPSPMAEQREIRLHDEIDWDSKFGGKKKIPFPKFSPETKKKMFGDDDFVFSLGSSCSIPCVTVNVLLTTSGCCLEVIGTGATATIRAVGDGTVSASYMSANCNFMVMVNGTKDAALLNDGDVVTITIQALNPNSECCQSCLINIACTSTYNYTKKNLLYRISSVEKGNKAYLNKQKLVEKVRRLKRRNP